MRRLIHPIFVIATSLLLGCAIPQPITEADRTFERVVEAPGYSKDQIFEATKIWIAENFRSAKAVLEYENKEAGTIIGNGAVRYPCSGMECIGKGNWKVLFTMRTDMKDNKFRLTFSNIQLSWPPSYSSTFGAQPGYTGPVNSRNDLEKIRPELLKFGDQVRSSIGKAKTTTNW